MDIKGLALQTVSYLHKNKVERNYHEPVPSMGILQHHAPSQISPTIYEPVICLILQGRKETYMGKTTFALSPGKSLLVSHDLPVTSQITKASRKTPYLALVLSLDLRLLRSLYEEVSEAFTNVELSTTCSMAVDSADPRFVDTLSRYLRLADDPLEQKVMGPLILREIHFRLLMAKYGGMLRELLRHDSHASNIARAIAILRRNFRTSMSVPDLARSIGMSSSSFHKHFRAITASTPLQYQKKLRLHEARRLLSVGDQAVSTIAYEVGYESPNQFSREYTRMFGASPSAHLNTAAI